MDSKVSAQNSNAMPGAALADYPLPGFIKRRKNDLAVDLSALDSHGLFDGFIDRLFSSGFRLVGGDYAAIQKLLYGLTAREIGNWAERLVLAGKAPEIRLANDVVVFPDSRRIFYRGWRPCSGTEPAEYFFEPIYLETVHEEPVFGEPEADGHLPLLCIEQRLVNELQTLDLDEFYASAWLNQVRFGWQVARIQAEFTREGGRFKAPSRLVVAQAVLPTPGQDATLVEQSDSLHRNDAPKVLHDGRVDLTRFRNRFPQVKASTVLLQKLPKVPGTAGHDVSGRELPPEPPNDFSIDELAGPGTRIERRADGEFVVATSDGFLNIDPKTNLISVTEKVISREGVNVRTTGNLSLQGEEFEEHGEVQERRVVEGMNMTFMADVFGNVVSRGGKISLRQHLAGGSAKSDGGVIEVLGGASRAVIEARGGEVFVKFAESSRIVGRKVRIERACLCEIVADELSIDLAEGCAIAATRLKVGTASARKSVETTVVIPLPDLSAYERKVQQAGQASEDFKRNLAALDEKLQALQGLPELKTFLLVQKKRAEGSITMTPEQEAQFRTLSVKAAPALRQMTELRAVRQTLQAQQQAVEQALAVKLQERDALLAALSCEIELVAGETAVRTRRPLPDEGPLDQLPPRELSIRLRALGTHCRPVFSGQSGSLGWRWAAAEG